MILRVDSFTEDQKNDIIQKFWKKDPSLWMKDNIKGEDIVNRLGWIDIISDMKSNICEIEEFSKSILSNKIQKVVLLGMGGSSLCPIVFNEVFEKKPGHPELLVLDTTDPEIVESTVNDDELSSSLFIVASKSGSTLEPNAMFYYFWHKISGVNNNPGDQFIAITDPGSPLATMAEQKKFRKIFLNPPDIGGRYSALSFFGLLPAAILGIDLDKLISTAECMVKACSTTSTWSENPAGKLTEFLSSNVAKSKDKLTIMTDPEIETFALWLEQLIAESSGKDTLGFVPVVGESTGIPGYYGGERIFVYIRYKNSKDYGRYNDFFHELAKSEFPVFTLEIDDLYDLGGQFFLWEMVTALTCHFISVNPFDEPDVGLAKKKTSEVLSKYQEQGKIPVNFWVDPQSNILFRPSDLLASSMKGLARTLRDLFTVLPTWGYLGFLPYLPYNDEVDSILGEIRHGVRQEHGCATVMGYGPRYLHSTGQVYKGGPVSAGFIILTRKKAKEYEKISEYNASFWHIQFAQAVGDFEALQETGKRVIHIHLSSDYLLGLKSLQKMISRASKL